MASPPEMNVDSVPGTDCSAAALPSDATVALTAASLAPVTVLSAVTTTRLLTGSRAKEVPGGFSLAVRVSLAAASAAALCATKRAVAPDAVTDLAVAASVTLTLTLPAESMYDPAVRLPNCLSSLLARVAAANDESPALGAADAGDATKALPTRRPTARPTIGRLSFGSSTGSSQGGGVDGA